MEAENSAPSVTIPESPVESPPHVSEDLNQLSESQLRELYENDEIERFLHLFSTYVNEVTAPEAYDTGGKPMASECFDSEGEWNPSGGEIRTQPAVRNELHHYDSISEEIAYLLLLPRLPPPRAPPQEFTLNRLRLASERAYLTIVPNYYPFLLSLYHLAKWRDKKKSILYCTVFWILWSQDVLLAAFFLHLILVMLKRRFLPYPSLSELKQHREEIHQADHFSEQLSQRLSAPSAFGVRDIWRFGRLFVFPPKEKRYIVRTKPHPHPTISTSEEKDESMVFEDLTDTKEIQEMKRLGLFLMNETADFHERVKNVFIWRRPSSSWLYFCLLSCLFLVSTLLPTRYLIKTIIGVLGFVFWHITPVVLALTPEERLRLPAPMSEVPTDAEYAMEMISQRVAAGLKIRPTKPSKGKQPAYTEPLTPHGSNMEGPTVFEDQFGAKRKRLQDMPDCIKGMGKAIDSGKSLLQAGRRLMSKMPTSPEDEPSFANLINPSPTTYTYPAQHTSAPGLITFTPSTLYFSPVTSTNSRITVPLQNIKGVKKVGVLKGIEILYTETELDGQRVDRVEKFRWVNNRDELFARLVSANGHMKWVK